MSTTALRIIFAMFCVVITYAVGLTIILENVTHKAFRSDMIMKNVTLKQDRAHVSIEFMLLKDVQSFDIRLVVDVLFKGQERSFKFLNSTMNMCKLLTKPSRNQLLNIFYLELREKSNIACPLCKVSAKCCK